MPLNELIPYEPPPKSNKTFEGNWINRRKANAMHLAGDISNSAGIITTMTLLYAEAILGCINNTNVNKH